MKANKLLNPLVMFTALFLTGCEKPVKLNAQYYSCTGAFPDNGNAVPKSKRYQYFLDQQVKNGFPGVVMLVKDDMERVWIGVSGKMDLSNNLPFEKCSRSRVSSVTKLFTATMIMSLDEQGIISIKDPVNKWVKHDITDRIENANEATIEQLLNHSSGIFNYTDGINLNAAYLNRPDKHALSEELLKYVYNKKSYFATGTKFEYSNTNYLLLGLIVESALGESVSGAIEKRIISKLQLTNTYYDPLTTPEGTARGYFDQYGNGKLFESTNYDILHFTPDAAMVSNVYDMATFIEALFSGRLVSDATLAKMKKEIPTNWQTNKGYGLGLTIWHTNFGTAYGHSGGQLGYQAKLFYFPDKKTTVAIIANGSGALLDKAMGDMISLVPPLLFN